MGKPTGAWKDLERVVAEAFGVKRNIKRGMDFGIEDTDVDVINRPEWSRNFIIDCKYRSNANMVIPLTFAEHSKECKDKSLTHVMIVHAPKKTYLAVKLEDFTADFCNNNGWLKWNRVWMSSMLMRSNAEYIDEWFEKSYNTYAPLKAEEFGVDKHTICPIVAMRAKGSSVVLLIPMDSL